MFETIQAPDNVLALRFSGDLSADDIRQYSHRFERAIQDGGRQLGAVIDITGLSDLNPSALESGAQADLAFLQHIGQFRRMAFVSDKQWPIALVGLLKVALPVIETRVFASAQQQQAVDWAAGATAVQQAAGGRPDVRGIQVIPSSDESVYAFEIDGTMSKEAVSRLVDDANAYFASHAQMKMLARIKHFGGVDLSALTQSGLLSMKFDAMKKTGKYAIVGAPGWMAMLVRGVDPLVSSIEMKTFAAEQEAAAWNWLGAKQPTS